ncbi:MAG TPA: CHAT domain-containing protein [Ilumatobacteraceae bacterium]|nr:CHAT domain-containing protein [Ilumatobacteraceae bacterium]
MTELESGGAPIEMGGLRLAATRGDVRVALPDRSAPPGSVSAALAAAGLEEVAGATVEAHPTILSRAPRRGGGPMPIGPDVAASVELTAPPPPPGQGQVLLVEDAGAFRWVFPEASAPGASRRRGAPAGSTFRINLVTDADDGDDVVASRGLVGRLAKKVLHVLTFELVDKVAGEVGDFFVRRWEEQARPHRLRTFTVKDYRLPAGESPDLLELAKGPALLVLHGVNCLTHSGFGRLPDDVVARLHQQYDGRVFAFDHPTLSIDPAENCRRLAEMLPADAGLEVDVLAHSRGGLVARMLTERADDVGIGSGRLRVRQVVFVATPSHGTPLADPDHLGGLVDSLTNLVDLVPDNPASPVLDTITGVVGVVKQLAVSAMKGLDGLMAMRAAEHDADGFLAQLNKPRPVTARYRAIASDYEPPRGSGLARIARDALFDHVFDYEPNDLIVPTSSTYQWNGATGFPITERVVLPAARGVDHSSFWTAADVIAAFERWFGAADPALRATPAAAGTTLARAAGPALLTGTEETDPLAGVDERLAAGDLDGVRTAIQALSERDRRALEAQIGPVALDRFARGAGASKAGRVFVLHGIMGSLLSAHERGGDSDRIWINPLRLVNGEFRRLGHPAGDDISADGLYRVYLPLIMGLDSEWDVVPVAFDWRLGIDAAADLLAKKVDEWGQPAHLVAHSMGGLVCRMLRARHRKSWDRLFDRGDVAKGGRLVMLGTPSLGSLSIATALTAEDKMVRWLARLDLRNNRDEVQQIVASFPGAYQLLPSPDLPEGESEHARLYDPASWEAKQVRKPLLDEARRIHVALATDGFDAARMLYVAGSGHDTPAKLRIEGPGRFRFQQTRAGDGRVTHDAGIARDANGRPAITKVWYSTADHGGLTTDRDVVAAVSELLRKGATDILPTEAPVVARRAPTTLDWVAGDELELPPLIDPIPLARAVRGRAPSRQQRATIARQYVDEATSSWLGTLRLVDAPLPTLKVSVRHASLEHASHLVVLGHYAGTPFGGAEEWADWLLGGRLTARQVLGRYPATPNDVLRVVPAGEERLGAFAGVAVIGLGEMGDLTPTALARALHNAAVEHALASVPPLLDADEPTPVTVGLSSVLVGSYGPDGLQVPTVVGAIVEGVLLANRELASSQTERPVRIDELEIVELYEQRAEDAARIVRDIERYLPVALQAGGEVRPSDRLVVGEGGRPSAPTAEYGAGMWRRLIVSGPDEKVGDGLVELMFTSLGARARADLVPHVVDNGLVGRMVRDAVGSARVDGTVNVALFELLLPNDLKRELGSVENLVLVVDEQTADIPWEALADRSALGGPEPLVKRMGFVRQLKLIDRPVGDVSTVHPRALVIGDPPAGALFPRLEGAQSEAKAVAEQLAAADVRVVPVIFEGDAQEEAGSAGAVIGMLLADDYQILHIAGHGWFDPEGRDGKPWGGVAIGRNQYLTAVEIGQMRRPPSLVFLNCCHLGSVLTESREGDGSPETADKAILAVQRGRLPQLAASLSRKLMAMGVRAVVAAGWSVDDRAAAEFAKVFYDRMLGGEAFGIAVRAARVAAHQVDGGASNTWAAYQCYGDPAFRLAAAGARSSSASHPVSAEELVRALVALAVQAGDPGADQSRIATEVRALEGLAIPPWDVRGDVWAALGGGFGECGALADSVRAYRKALMCADAHVSLKAVEQLANLEVRLAAALESPQPPDKDELAALIALEPKSPVTATTLRDTAKARIATLLALGRTAERVAINAGFWKAVAASTRGRERTTALRTAARAYAEAWRLDGKPYGALCALQLDGIGGLLQPSRRAAILAAIDAPDFVGPATDFWGRVAHPELALTRALIDASLSDGPTLDAIKAAYIDVFRHRSTARERGSPTRYVAELAILVRDPAVAAALADLAEHLAEWRP